MGTNTFFCNFGFNKYFRPYALFTCFRGARKPLVTGDARAFGTRRSGVVELVGKSIGGFIFCFGAGVVLGVWGLRLICLSLIDLHRISPAGGLGKIFEGVVDGRW